MSVHNHVASIATTGLVDECPRCSEQAENPFEFLDDGNIRALIDRTRAWMRDEELGRSSNETKAMRIVETAIRQKRVLDWIGGAE